MRSTNIFSFLSAMRHEQTERGSETESEAISFIDVMCQTVLFEGLPWMLMSSSMRRFPKKENKSLKGEEKCDTITISTWPSTQSPSFAVQVISTEIQLPSTWNVICGKLISRARWKLLIQNKLEINITSDVKAYFTIGSQVGFNKLTQRAAAHKKWLYAPLIFN